jgi:hypothetical protein
MLSTLFVGDEPGPFRMCLCKISELPIFSLKAAAKHAAGGRHRRMPAAGLSWGLSTTEDWEDGWNGLMLGSMSNAVRPTANSCDLQEKGGKNFVSEAKQQG